MLGAITKFATYYASHMSGVQQMFFNDINLNVLLRKINYYVFPFMFRKKRNVTTIWLLLY